MAAPSVQKAILLEEKSFPISADGKTVGECRVAKGAAVNVLAVDGEKVLVAASPVSSAWIDKSLIKLAPDKTVEDFSAREPTAVESLKGTLAAAMKNAVKTAEEKINAAAAEAAKPEAVESLKNSLADAVRGVRKTAEAKIAGAAATPEPTAKPASAEMKELSPASPRDEVGSDFAMPSNNPETISGNGAKPQDSDAARQAIRGSAVEVFLVESLQSAWGGDDDAGRKAERAVDGLKVDSNALPQSLLSSLAGKPIKNGTVKGCLLVTMDSEGAHIEKPGFSEDEIDILKSALADKEKHAVVKLVKKDWGLEKGEFRREKRLQKSGSETVLLSGYEGDSFLCRKSKNGGGFELGRLQVDDLRLGGTAYALATVDWQADPVDAAALPADFHYDKSLIIPGQFAFLALPFEKQGKGGICAAASALNIMRFIDPSIQMEQRELFSLYNGGQSGASLDQVQGGLESLGFESEWIQTANADKKTLIAKIRASLDAGRPVLATIPGHALTIIGYNKPSGKIIAWDQRMHVPGKPDYLPRGAYETSEASLHSRFDSAFFIRKVENKLNREEAGQLAAIICDSSGWQHQEIVNGSDESLIKFLRHAAPPKMESLLRRGQTILIPKGRKEVVSILSVSDGKWSARHLPGGREESFSDATLARLLTESNGVFFSGTSQTP